MIKNQFKKRKSNNILKINLILILISVFSLCFINIASADEDIPFSNTWDYVLDTEGGSEIFEEGLELNVPILGLTEIKNITQYIVGIYNALLYVIIPVTIIIIMYAGVLWLSSGFNNELKSKAVSYFLHALAGLGIAFLSTVMLSLIGITEITDPTLEKIEAVSFVDPEIMELVLASLGSDIQESANMTSDEITELGKKIAGELGIDPCVVVTKFKLESAGKPNAIGHDVLASGTESKRKYGSIGSKECPNETINTNDDLGLDWRYSHGIGLGQLTFFPPGYKYHESCNGGISRTFAGECFTPKMALSVRKNIEASLKLWKSKFNGTDYRSAFRKYNGSGSRAEKYATKAMKIFNKCKSGG